MYALAYSRPSSVLRWLSSNGHQPVTAGVSWLGMSTDESVNSAETKGRSYLVVSGAVQETAGSNR